MSADYAEFGKYLTRQRELRGLSREDVSGSTRIPLALVAALEDGELDRLPGRVFVKNYIRAYAEEIGLSPDEAVLRFEEIEQEQAAASGDAPALRKTGKGEADARRPRWPLWIALVLIALAAALVGTGRLPGLGALRGAADGNGHASASGPQAGPRR